MKTRISGLVAVAVLSVGAAGVASAAPNGVAPRLSLQLKDGTDLAIGVEGRFGLLQLASSVRLDVRPFFDYYFVDSDSDLIDVTSFGFGGDALFAFNIGNTLVEPYALAGITIGYTKVDVEGVGDDSETDFGLNLGGGAKFLTAGKIQPFVELRFSVGDFDPILLTGGVLFIL